MFSKNDVYITKKKSLKSSEKTKTMGDTAEQLSKLVLVNSKECLVEESTNRESYLSLRLSCRAHSPKGILSPLRTLY